MGLASRPAEQIVTVSPLAARRAAPSAFVDADERDRDAGDRAFEGRQPGAVVDHDDGGGAGRLAELGSQDPRAGAASRDDDVPGHAGVVRGVAAQGDVAGGAQDVQRGRHRERRVVGIDGGDVPEDSPIEAPGNVALESRAATEIALLLEAGVLVM